VIVEKPVEIKKCRLVAKVIDYPVCSTNCGYQNFGYSHGCCGR
jgi:hypothetical protein